MLERLVCNFAPKGNIHGKPIYSIGYAGTQCSNVMVPDDIYKGLCNYEDHHLLKTLTTQNRTMNSLLRILNLSNNSAKNEIDPLGNNLKQILVNSSSNNEHRNQKTRHIYLNNSYGPIRRMMPLQKHNTWKSVVNMTRNDDDYHYQHERGHSHLYHGHNLPQTYSYPITSESNYHSNQDFRRYDYTTQTVTLVSNSNYRKFYQQAQCTRKWPQIESNSCCGSNQCEKGHDNCWQQTTCPTPCPEQFTNPVLDLCSCTVQTCPTTCPSTCTTSCNCNMHCQYSSPMCPTTTNCLTTSCREMHCNDCRKSGSFQNYDMFPNVVLRSGNKRVLEIISTKKEPSLFDSSKITHSHQRIYEGSDELQRDETDMSKYNFQDRDYLYRSFDRRLRKRRQLDDQMTLVPFWQLEKSNYKNPSLLKSMRYTTLSNKNNRNTKRNTALAKWLSSTEPITLNKADYEDDEGDVTEKYLSFNELMHLRKINDRYAVYDFRRDDSAKTTKKKSSTNKTTKATKASTNKTTKTTKSNKTVKVTTEKTTKATVPKTNATTTTATADADGETKTTTAKTTKTTTQQETIIYTLNPPFSRLRYCTRKLTCTWTAYTANSPDNEGNIVGPIDVGSRTPPGYVEGCTRTSTCTRINMDRNKVFTVPTGDGATYPGEKGPGDFSTGTGIGDDDDGDYCERRSLNVQRRNSDNKENLPYELNNQVCTDLTTRSGKIQNELDITPADVTTDVSDVHDCVCVENNSRQKRQVTSDTRKFMVPGDMHCRNSKKSFSYGELYYMILNSIYGSKRVNQYHHNECPCNYSPTSRSITPLFLLVYFITIFNVCIYDIL
ncbi:uncharacterized protein LOC113500435 isoform X2 [Trichoplusia ni]|nr:uncharacterized protein LOC113500435 isoform X2 [Trichoplusia ni]